MQRESDSAPAAPVLIEACRDLPADTRIVAPVELLRALRAVLEQCLGEGIRVSLHGAYNLCHVQVNPIELEHALRQLALNARDLMPNGGPLDVTIWLHAAPKDGPVPGLPDGHYLAIRFSDGGFGMTPETLRRVFDDSPAANEWRESIMDRLRRIRRFAVRSGGHLKIESRLGFGAKTDVFLPTV